MDDSNDILRSIEREVRGTRFAVEVCMIGVGLLVLAVAALLLGFITVEFRPIR